MTPDTSLVVLTTVPREYEAQLIVAALEHKGIKAHQAGGHISGFKAEAPGEVLIYVKPEDRDRALQAYAEIREGSDDIDWSQVDIGDPEE